MTKSRWAYAFAMHPFQNVWQVIKNELASAEVDDQTVVTAVTELARFKRVISYLDEIIKTVDPDLTPRSVWSNFQSQSDACLQQLQAFLSNKNIAHIEQANEHVDNLLTYVRPYMVLPQEAVIALKKSAQDYASQLENHISSFRDRAEILLKEIIEDRDGADARLRELENANDKIAALSKELFDGADGVESTKKQIQNFVADITAKAEQVKAFHVDLIVDFPGKNSILTQTENAVAEVNSRRNLVTQAQEMVDVKLTELDGFYEKIFGTFNSVTGEPIVGLKDELNNRMIQLTDLEIDHGIKHKALFEKIESLLPGATSAGLASAYQSLKESFKTPIANYTRNFYFSLGLIAIGTVLFAIQSVSTFPLKITFTEIKSWDEILRRMVGNAGYFIPTIWLALFSATRRSQYERLQQEYAHKEAFASSYESYKQQLHDLKGTSEDLQRALIEKAVETIAYNASTTLNGKHHEEKSPLLQLLEKGSFEPLQKLIVSLKRIKALVDKP